MPLGHVPSQTVLPCELQTARRFADEVLNLVLGGRVSVHMSSPRLLTGEPVITLVAPVWLTSTGRHDLVSTAMIHAFDRIEQIG